MTRPANGDSPARKISPPSLDVPRSPATMPRRDFVRAMAVTGLAAMTLNAHAGHGPTRSTIRAAVVGFGGRGKDLIKAVEACPRMTLVALCDVDRKILAEHDPANIALVRTGNAAELLERDDIDAIVSATPNHWHSLLTMQACAAGKHVYIEKPISHNLLESRQVVAAARRYDRIVQCGFQNRSDSALRPFFQRLHAGEFGRVLSVHGTCHRARDPIGKLDQPLQIPDSIDYDRWLGPAADLPVMRPRLHYDWHWDFNTGNGDVGNQGPHEWDLMNWALGDPELLPVRMTAGGGRFGWNDAGNTPNVMACSGESASGVPFSFEVMDLRDGGPAPRDNGVGILIETEAGLYSGGRGKGRFTWSDGREENFQRDPAEQGGDGTITHMNNFAEAILAGDRSLLHSEAATAANSAGMAHLANIAYRVGKESSEYDILAAFNSTARTREMIARLVEAPRLFASKHQATIAQEWKLGTGLAFDGKAYAFVGPQAEEANRLMTRDYRPGYGLPEV